MPDVTEADLRRGLECGELQAFLQPLVDLREGHLIGFEALARWQHPRLGWLLPSRFLPFARKMALDRLLTEHIVGEACRTLCACPDTILLSVNISAQLVCDPELPDWLGTIVESAGLPIGRLIVELTETGIIGSYERARTVCERLRVRGARVVVDDFGTGYANLRHVNELPLDALKIDASFVRSILQRQPARDIIASLVGLGNALGIGLMAEGIEDPRQAEILGTLGCQIGQGWLFGRAMSADDVHAAIRARTWRMPPSRAAALETLVPRAPTGTQRRRRLADPLADAVG